MPESCAPSLKVWDLIHDFEGKAGDLRRCAEVEIIARKRRAHRPSSLPVPDRDLGVNIRQTERTKMRKLLLILLVTCSSQLPLISQVAQRQVGITFESEKKNRKFDPAVNEYRLIWSVE